MGRLSSHDPRRRSDLIETIVTNVAAILNTHEGDGYTCPTMGCDFVSLMSRWPSSEVDLLSTVRRSVEMYEPRLRNVQVRRVPNDEHVISLEITGELRDGGSGRERIRMQTELGMDGHIEVG